METAAAPRPRQGCAFGSFGLLRRLTDRSVEYSSIQHVMDSASPARSIFMYGLCREMCLV